MRQVSDATVGSKAPHEQEDLIVRVITSFEDLSAAADEWDAFIEDCGSDIYFTYDWMETWWKYYGRNRVLRCFFIHKAGKPVAALPFMFERFGLGPISIRLAKFVGADSTITVFTPAIVEDYEEACLKIIFKQLLDVDRCDAISFSPLSGATSVSRTIRIASQIDQALSLVRDASTTSHVIVKLPGTFDEFLQNLSKQHRYNFRRHLRRLGKHYELENRVVTGPDITDCFDVFVALHQSQWIAQGHLGHFGDWPHSLEFNRDLLEKMAAKGRVCFHELIGTGKVLSMQFSFFLGDRSYWRLPARQADEDSNRLGVGRLAYVLMLEALIEQGIHLMEAGPGHYNYKIQNGGEELRLQHMMVSRSSRLARFKSAAAIIGADLVHLIYYRLWFQKIAPQLRLPKRPLWSLWVRSRI